MAKDPEQLAHMEWIGYVQPTGLVVSIPALLQAQAHVRRNIAEEHQRFLACLPRDKHDEPIPEIRDFPEFTRTVLGWEAGDLLGVPDGEPVPPILEATLPGYNETLRPTYAVREFKPQDASREWILLVKSLPVGTDLDALFADAGSHWQATPHSKFERLLRETQVPIGLLVNGTHLRLVYAPRGETSGFATFSVADMAKVAGRPIFAALHMLLEAPRLFTLPEKQRLPAILADSRKYQNVVSTKLSEQVLAALYELVRGLQSADEQRRGELLREVLAADPNHVYAGLLTVLLRLVFVLYAEDRGLLSNDPVYSNYYSVTGLFERLRADQGRYTDTMDQRYGAWAQLLTLFRLIYDGGQHGGLKIPPRRGYLFDPDRYNFLEGRPWKLPRHQVENVDVPRIADGVIYRVLEKLLILDGERLSYRTLDVEQIGSVYETIMGFNLEVAQGRSIAIKPTKSHGAPSTINLDELLATKSADRLKWLQNHTEQKFTGQAAEGIKSATTLESLLAALERKIAHHATPNVVPKDSMVLQPSDERRRSGSHYTPRSLTEPIVRTTLKPILEQLGAQPRPEQILALKVCDPAMGSGAFLVEACRQLAEALIESWRVYDCLPVLPPDEDEVLHARRLIAQCCLYGVDKNRLAVDLAKLSLWLATLAKDHPFTFLDHSLRHGDSLVGLTREQLVAFHWQPDQQRTFLEKLLRARFDQAADARRQILTAAENVPYQQQDTSLALADEALNPLRLLGDAVIAAFFSAEKDKARRQQRDQFLDQVEHWAQQGSQPQHLAPLTAAVAALRSGEHPIPPFHWEIEFPEVFTVDAKGMPTGGFDAIVGNPPFMGGTQISEIAGMSYFQWLVAQYPPCEHHCDLVAYFFRRAFSSLRPRGCLGLIATNTVAQGDTREGGLRAILQSGGQVFCARHRVMWPGQAAVIVSVVHISKALVVQPVFLDEKRVHRISAFLFVGAIDESPSRLTSNPYYSLGSKIYGQGFLFSDNDPECTSLEERRRILQRHPEWESRLPPYLVGEEINSNPLQQPGRYVIYLSDVQEEVQLDQWPRLRDIVATKVKPERMRLGSNPNNIPLKRRWWAYQAHRPELYAKISAKGRVLCLSRHGNALAFAFCATDIIFSEAVVVLDLDRYDAFGVMQCRVHEVWTRFLASSIKDDLRYTPSDCFETFPFPAGVLEHAAGDSPTADNGPLTTLEATGREYYEFRAALMVRNDEGLTKTYNRFHDPHESSPDILRLRELHADMDRAVLEAYGWHDLAQTATCEFLLDYEEDEDADEPPPARPPKGRNPGATAGPTTSATKSSPACWN